MIETETMNDTPTKTHQLKAIIPLLAPNEKAELLVAVRQVIQNVKGTPHYSPSPTASPRFREALESLYKAERELLEGFEEVQNLLEWPN
jgi:hypothetical protein